MQMAEFKPAASLAEMVRAINAVIASSPDLPPSEALKQVSVLKTDELSSKLSRPALKVWKFQS